MYAMIVFRCKITVAGYEAVCVCVCLQKEAVTGYLAQHQLFDQVTFCFSDPAQPGPALSASVYIHISKYMK